MEPAEPQTVDALGRRMRVRWDEGVAATPHGQLVRFAEFLTTAGAFDRWVSKCLLEYLSVNAPVSAISMQRCLPSERNGVRDCLGLWGTCPSLARARWTATD